VDRHCATRVCDVRAGLGLTLAIHHKSTTNMSITNQHVLIVEIMPIDLGHVSWPPKATSGA
jgi:hypothetical protein